MKITVIGTGYVGLVSGACLAEVGNDVLCLDLDAAKIKILEDGGIPIFEPGLQEMVRRNVAGGRLHFTTDVERAAHFGTIQFIAVGTPPDEDGSADMKYVTAAARNIGRYMTGGHPRGTGQTRRGDALQRGVQPRVLEGRRGHR
jgi:UDPglucose 6-dehydrogenase